MIFFKTKYTTILLFLVEDYRIKRILLGIIYQQNMLHWKSMTKAWKFNWPLKYIFIIKNSFMEFNFGLLCSNATEFGNK